MEPFIIVNSTHDDIPEIFSLYDAAVAYQKERFDKHWQTFDIEVIEKEISEKRQWKMLINDQIACIFVTTDNDALIWGEKEDGQAIYLHRIVTSVAFRGNNSWA
jgi:hypothetical protein